MTVKRKAKVTTKKETFYDHVKVNQVIYISMELDSLPFTLETTVRSIFTVKETKIVQLNLPESSLVQGYKLSQLVLYVGKDKDISYEMIVDPPNGLDVINPPTIKTGTDITVEGWF
jgi:hypothetical protein